MVGHSQSAEWTSQRKGMPMRSIVSALAAVSLVVASSASADAAPATATGTRISSPVQATEAASGDSTWLWVAGGALLILVLIITGDDDEDDLASSP